MRRGGKDSFKPGLFLLSFSIDPLDEPAQEHPVELLEELPPFVPSHTGAQSIPQFFVSCLQSKLEILLEEHHLEDSAYTHFPNCLEWRKRRKRSCRDSQQLQRNHCTQTLPALATVDIHTIPTDP